MDLSIIIPVYNAEKYLKQCLDSICAELTEKMELIIVDDGSKDKSSRIYEEYENKNIRILKNDNRGVSYSRNFGIKKAIGKYILFVDADDYLTSGWSKIISKAINKNEDLIIFTKEGKVLDRDEIFKSIFNINPSIKYLSTVWSKLYKKEIIIKNDIKFSENVINGEDMLFNVNAIAKAQDINFINENIYNYRINYSSSTHKFNKKIFESDREFHIKLKEICIKNQLDENIYCDWCLENAICMLVQRMAYMKKKEWHEYKYIFKEHPYCDYISSAKEFHSKKDKIVINFIKKNKLNMAIYFCKIMRKIKKSTSSFDEKIVKI